MSIQAYQQAANKTADPRDVEYRLFAQVTRALIDVQSSDRSDIKARIHALDWNRRVWSALALDCSQPTNQLPEKTRASIISLSIFVNKHTSAVARGVEGFDTLIEINRSIMQGLAASLNGEGAANADADAAA